MCLGTCHEADVGLADDCTNMVTRKFTASSYEHEWCDYGSSDAFFCVQNILIIYYKYLF